MAGVIWSCVARSTVAWRPPMWNSSTVARSTGVSRLTSLPAPRSAPKWRAESGRASCSATRSSMASMTASPPGMSVLRYRAGRTIGNSTGADGTSTVQQAEPMAPIQRDVRGVRRLEIDRRALSVSLCERVLQQRRPESGPLPRGVHTEKRQVPVRLGRMPPVQLRQRLEEPGHKQRVDRALDHLAHQGLVGRHAGPQPDGDARELRHFVGRSVLEGVAPESPDESRKPREIPRGLG